MALGAGAVIRLAGLGRFPRLEADEGLWTTSTKNFLLYGDWFLDGRVHLLYSPFLHVLTLPVYWVLGPGIEASRLISAMAGVGTIAVTYFLALSLALGPAVAGTAAIICAINEWSVVLTRKALVEPLETFLVASAFLAVTRGNRRGALLGGTIFGLALLTKSNVLALLPLLTLTAAFLQPTGTARPRREQWENAAILVGAAFLVGGAGYLWLYRQWPEAFVRAFAFVMEGRDQVPDARPLVSMGRFGLEPRVIARTTLELFRESPFLLVLGGLGTLAAALVRPRGWAVLIGWVALWTTFCLLQLYQPLRYFYIAFPALAILAAYALNLMARGTGRREVLAGLLILVVTFEASYVLANALTNREERVATLATWARSHLSSGDVVMASSVLALDLPVKSLGYYYIAPTPEDVATAVDRYDVDYVLWDRAEWPLAYRDWLEDHYERVADWDFGSMYRTLPPRGSP